MELFWILFTWVGLGLFAIAEYLGIRGKKPYTRYLRKWLGLEPERKGIKWTWYSFIGLWVIFTIWLPLHLACVWPWENC